MEIIRQPESISETSAHALTIGAYDGVHRGHQAVIRQTQQIASSLGVLTAVVTFEPHPARVLRPESAPLLLTNLDHKLELLEESGVDTVLVIPFDEEWAAYSPADFVDRALIEGLRPKAVVVGQDFHFGSRRTGNVDVLRELGVERGFEVHGVDLLPRPDGKVESVSSTAIRRALDGGEIATASRLLGRPHELRGPVVKGDQRGRTIGFPTANVAVSREMKLPADAVYAAWFFGDDGERRPAAVNIGKRPTFYQDAERSLLEAHLIGFDGDLYGQEARVQFVELIRSEQRFEGIDALRDQLQRDVAHAAELLDKAKFA